MRFFLYFQRQGMILNRKHKKEKKAPHIHEHDLVTNSLQVTMRFNVIIYWITILFSSITNGQEFIKSKRLKILGSQDNIARQNEGEVFLFHY